MDVVCCIRRYLSENAGLIPLQYIAIEKHTKTYKIVKDNLQYTYYVCTANYTLQCCMFLLYFSIAMYMYMCVRQIILVLLCLSIATYMYTMCTANYT